jgi:hypothetical protein
MELKKNHPHHLISTAMAMTRCKSELDLGLTDATDLNVPQGAIDASLSPQVSLSPDGSRAYIVYTNVAPSLPAPVVPAAQFLSNVGGKLVVTSTINTDPAFSAVDGGSANPCFTLFSLLDDTIATPTTGGVAAGRVRIFNASGNVVAERTFADVNPDPNLDGIGTFSQIGWSPDGRFFAVQYTLVGTTAGSITTVIRVLDATRADLPVVASYQVTTTVFLNPGAWFRLPVCPQKKKEKKCGPVVACAYPELDYIALNVANGSSTLVPGTNIFLATTGCPNSLQILRFMPTYGSLTLVAEAAVPASPIGLAAWPRTELQTAQAQVEQGCFKELKSCVSKAKCDIQRTFALIAVSTIVVTGTSEVSPFRTLEDGTSLTNGCLGNDAADLRVYAFNGQGLVLASAVNTNLRGAGSIAFTPDGKYLFTGLRTSVPVFSSENPEILAIYKVPLKPIGEFFADPKEFTDERLKCLRALDCPGEKKSSHSTSKKCPDVRLSCLPPAVIGTDNAPFVSQAALFTPEALACLDLIRVKGGSPLFPSYNFSDNSQWFVASGLTVGGIFSIQLFRVVRSSC